MEEKGSGPQRKYQCSFFPFCGGARRTAEQREPVVLQLRGEQLQQLCVTFPRRDQPYDAKFVEAKLKQLRLLPPIGGIDLSPILAFLALRILVFVAESVLLRLY